MFNASVHHNLHMILFLLLITTDLITGKHQQLIQDEFEMFDVLVIARCESKCWNYTKSKHTCVKICLQKGFLKPGNCPTNNASSQPTLSPFETPCLETCKNDLQCHGITKCCKHSCGISCQHPYNMELISNSGIPNIPKEIILKGRRHKSLFIDWNASNTLPINTIVYIIEERHHNGKYFMEKRMGDWRPCYMSAKVGTVLKHFIKPGRWYQFRIAAVNLNGTLGYSENYAYSPSIGPRKPKAPQGMLVGPVWNNNGSLYTKLRWKAPQSDLPIQKYKVFWSRRLQGVTDLDSVLVLQKTLPKEETSYVIQNLEPNSLYFLQVQALTQFGKEVLKSEKSNLLLNTTNYINVFLGLQNTTNILEIQLQRLFWSQGDLKARISWKSTADPQKFIVNWFSNSCKSENGISQIKLSASTKVPHFDLYDLQFNCNYIVIIKELLTEDASPNQSSFITLLIPSCKELQSNNKKIKCISNKL